MFQSAQSALQRFVGLGKRATPYGEDTAPLAATMADAHAALGGDTDVKPIGLAGGGVSSPATLSAFRAKAARLTDLRPPSAAVIAAAQAQVLPELPRVCTTEENTFGEAARAARAAAAEERRQAQGDDGGPCPMGDDDEPPAAPPRGKQRKHAERNDRHNNQFTNLRPQHKADFVLFEQDVVEQRNAESLALLAFYIARLEQAVQSHPCKTRLRDVTVTVIQTSDVHVVTPTAQFSLAWPTCISCSHCDLKERGQLSPLALGLFPANPSYAHILFDTRVLDLAGELTMGSRVSFEGTSRVSRPACMRDLPHSWALTLAFTLRQHTLLPCGRCTARFSLTCSSGTAGSPSTGAFYAPCVCDAPLVYCVLTGCVKPCCERRVSSATHDLDQLEVPGAPSATTDPLLNCAVCSSCGDCEPGCPRLSVKDEPAAPPEVLAGGSAPSGWLARVLALCCDGCAKATRFRLAGRSDNSKPALNLYAGAANEEVQKAEAPGAPQDEETLQDHCTATLTCANDRASKRSWLDVVVMMAFVCRHGMPVRGAVCYSNRPETFLPYRILLKFLLAHYIIMFIMFDNGCRLGVSFMQQFADGLGGNVPLMLVGWMHARGHVERCRLRFSGLYHKLLGRTVGETTETLWSKFLNWEITRKMSRARRHDFLECVLKRIADGMEERMPEMLFSSWAGVHKKLAVCRKKVADIEAEAESLNMSVAELTAGTLEYVQAQRDGGATSGLIWEAELVKQYTLAKVGVSPETPLSLALTHGTGTAYSTAAARKRAEKLIMKIERPRTIDVFSRDTWLATEGARATAALTASLLQDAKDNVYVRLYALTIAKEIDNDRAGCVAPAECRRRCAASAHVAPHCPS
jgi:hypothetical protein